MRPRPRQARHCGFSAADVFCFERGSRHLSRLPFINEAISRRRHSLFGHVRRMDHDHMFLPTKPYISQSRHDKAQDSLTSGEDNQVVRENAGWSRSPRAQGSLLLMLGVLQRIGQHGGRYNPSTVKRRERAREKAVNLFELTAIVRRSHSRKSVLATICMSRLWSKRVELGQDTFESYVTRS